MTPKELAAKVTAAATANIVQIVGDYVELKSKGDIHVGGCPFHKGLTPTLMVNAEKGFYYCSECHRGGNAVDFVMEAEKISSYKEAINFLCAKLGTSKEDDDDALMEFAAQTYEADLRNTEEGQTLGLTYFASRGFTDQTIATFRLGYSLKDSNSLSNRALAAGWTDDDLIGNSLRSVNEQTADRYDFFRGRAMFPIQDPDGKVIAFGARVLDARTKGVDFKYLNSHETKLYKKSEALYGICQAKDEIKTKDKCYIVEGYTDVISMHQFGVRNVVAGCGTALTHEHIRILKGYTESITLLYDSDSAGDNAALKGIDIALREGVNVSVLHLPEGEDPDSYARSHTAEEFAAYAESHEVDFLTFKAETLMAGTDGDLLKVNAAVHDVVASIAEVQDAQERIRLVEKCAKIVGLSENSIIKELDKAMEQKADEHHIHTLRGQTHKEDPYALMEFAAQTYEADLRNTEEGQALGLTYFASRGFTDQTMATFRLGYSLKGSNSLSNRALAAGWTDDDLIGNSLRSVNEQTADRYDFFRGRAMFPIQDPDGKVIAFGARVLDARTKGVDFKYLNSHETDLYKKEKTLYGLSQAKEEIMAKGKCYIVEGYTDVISMHQCGVRNIVAGCGTALTPEHIRILKDYTENITLLYDSDNAGNGAALKGIDIALREGVNVSVLHLPEGEDPDSYARSHTAEEFAAYVESHEVDFLTFKAETLMAGTNGDLLKVNAAVHDIVASIAEVQDAEERISLVGKCSKLVGLSENAIIKALDKAMVQNAEERHNRMLREQARKEAAQAQAEAQAAAAAPFPDDLPPDLSPSEIEMLRASMTTPRPAATPQRPAQTAVPTEVEMREIIRYLVTYTQSTLHIWDGEQTAEMTVGDYISGMLAADGLEPQDATLRAILNEYRQAPDRTLIDDRHFLAMPDAGIRSFVAQAIGGRPLLSKMHSKYSPVELEKDSLDEFVPRAVQELQMTQVMKMIEDTTTEMNNLIAQGADDEAIEAVMKNLNDLNMVKRELSLQMGERAIVKMYFKN